MFFDVWFYIGILIYFIFFVLVFLYSKKAQDNRTPLTYEKKDRIYRYTLGALILSLCWVIFGPVWFSEKKFVPFDPYRLLLIVTAIIASITTYKSYVKNKSA